MGGWNGVLIVHQVEEGKHEYEVKNVVKLKNSSWKKVFVRYDGDKLMQINGKDLRDVTPEEVAEMLAEGNPMLTIHKPGKKQVKPGEEAPPCKETLQPFSKEYTTLTFEWKMIRGEQSEVCQQEKEKEEEEEAETELEYKEEERMEEKDLLVIKMTKTSISLVRGRGCDVNSPCQGCNGSGCVFNDIVVVAESSQVTLVPRGSDSFQTGKMLNVLVEHCALQALPSTVKLFTENGLCFANPGGFRAPKLV
uniref:Uncharacterized protein n=1 Tax=Gouania willdenowi TaxID=441366 RepID=A0A8C5DC25_GOUWI